MLVLTRFVGEQIVITVGSERIIVKLCDVQSGNKARLGFIAPQHVRINRGEVQKREDAERADNPK